MLPRARRAAPLSLSALVATAVFALGCSSSSGTSPPVSDAGHDAKPTHDATSSDAKADVRSDAKRDVDSGGDARVPMKDGASGPTMLVFDLAADLTKPDNFYDAPFPSDLRLNATGGPDYAAFPLPQGSILETMIAEASARKGFSTLAVAYFHFTAPMASLDPTAVIPAGPASNILLLDVDPTSPDRGTFFPTVAATAPEDSYTAANVISVAARPGFVLYPNRKYAFVIRREQLDKAGGKLAVAPTLATLASGQTPSGTLGKAAAALYAPLFDTLKTAGIAADDVAAATVFTTGDEVQVTSDMSNAILAKYTAPISGLTVAQAESDAGSTYPRICEIKGTITLPQFQTGTTPFASTGGTFVLDAQGVPEKQGEAPVPFAISLPTTGPMPTAGYPLVLYFHGTGGVSTEFIDRGPILVPDGGQVPGQGPAYVLAPFGFAMAGASLPTSPERVPGTDSNTDPPAYIQLGNLPSLLGNFRQGVIEQRLFLAALAKLTLPASLLKGCPAVDVPGGGRAKLDPKSFFSQGQSMGGMYANLITAVEPTFRAEVPTGAGGFWTYFIFQSAFVPGANGELQLALGVQDGQLTFMHPALSMVETGWEAIDPIVSVPRVSRRPLAGTKPRPIFEPVGQNDLYFSEDVYNAVALAYGHREVGTVLWSEMQTALGEESLSGIVSYPASQDVHAVGDGGVYTGVVVQYPADTITQNGHDIAFQLDAVKYQYGCFLSSVLKTGVGTVPAPAALGTPCP